MSKVITVYNSKGGVGKTPISLNIFFDNDDYLIATNESYHIFDIVLSNEDDRYYSVGMDEELEAGDFNMIFDLAGSISIHSKSIVSAIKASDVVIVPIVNELKSMVAGVNTIQEITKLNKDTEIIVVVTKLERVRQDIFEKNDWSNSKQFLEVKNYVTNTFKGTSIKIDFLPLKRSKAFDEICEESKSIKQIMRTNPIRKYNYQVVGKQFEAIYELMN